MNLEEKTPRKAKKAQNRGYFLKTGMRKYEEFTRLPKKLILFPDKKSIHFTGTVFLDLN